MSEITRIKNEILGTNTYLYLLGNTKDCFVIDPGLSTKLIIEELERKELNPIAILCTHGHFDHIASAQAIFENYYSTIYLHEDDEKIMKSSNFLLMACHIKKKIKIPKEVQWLKGINNTFELNNTKITFHHSPGHTQGSCLIEIKDILFTGDTIFKNIVLENSIAGSDTELLKKSLLKYIFFFPKETVVYPGHGRGSSLGDIINNNNHLRKFLELDTYSNKKVKNHEY
jgi:hydroxyacylglutathione hydrolase